MFPLQFDFFGLSTNLNAFMILFIGFGAMAGAFSRKLSISAFGALLVYTYVVMKTDIFIFNALLYLVLGIIFLWVSFQITAGYLEAGEGVDT